MATIPLSGKMSRLSLAQWQDFVEAHPLSTAFHHRNWIELLIEQYHFPLHIPALKEGGEIVAAVPFLETRKPWGAKKLISLPFTDCVPVLAKEDRALDLMLDGLRGEPFGNYKSVVLRTDRPLGDSVGTSHRVRHELSTARPLEEIRARYPTSLKRNLRKANESGLRFERRTDADAMEAFYRLHLGTRKKHGVPIQPKSFFTRLYERFVRSGLGFIGLVFKDKVAITAAVFLTYNKTMIFKYSASDARALARHPNEYLVDNAICLAGNEGHVRFNFGMSSKRDEGLRHFKRKWGATETQLYHEYILGRRPTSDDDSPAQRIMAYWIRRSPTILCRVLGEMLYKYSQ